MHATENSPPPIAEIKQVRFGIVQTVRPVKCRVLEFCETVLHS